MLDKPMLAPSYDQVFPAPLLLVQGNVCANGFKQPHSLLPEISVTYLAGHCFYPNAG